jgi:uncharacterized surface protein with fasciclin (FAS1) repeats
MLSFPVLHLLAVAASLHGATAVSTHRHLQATQTIAQIVASDPELTILAAALTANADLLDSLTGPSFTLLAPTDAAFAALIAKNATVADRVFNKTGYVEHYQELLGLHIADEAVVMAADLTTGEKLTMSTGVTVTVGAGPTFAGPSNDAAAPAKVTAADITAANGVIHKIDTVLLPGYWNADVVTLAETADIPSLTTLKKLFLQVKDDPSSAAILQTAKLLEVTMFAPTDDAFAELGDTAIAAIAGTNSTLLLNVLQNHVVLNNVYPSDALVDGFAVPTLRNGPLIVSREDVLGEGEVVKVGESLVLEPILVRTLFRCNYYHLYCFC